MPLPLGSASSLATINHLAKKLKTADMSDICAEWAEQIEKLSAELLTNYQKQVGAKALPFPAKGVL